MGGQPKIPLFNSLLRNNDETLDCVKQTLKQIEIRLFQPLMALILSHLQQKR